MPAQLSVCSFFFFNDTATTEIYTLSLHDALPICRRHRRSAPRAAGCGSRPAPKARSEEHTSELQSRGLLSYAVFCLKKKNNTYTYTNAHSAKPTPRHRLHTRD